MNENRYGTTLSPVLDEEILNNPKSATVEVCFIYFFYQAIIYMNLIHIHFEHIPPKSLSFRTMKIRRTLIASNETQNVRKDTIQTSTDLHSDR